MAAEKAAHEARRSTNWSIVATFLSAVSLSDYDINDRPTTFISKGPALTTEHIHIEPFRLNLVHEQYAAKKG